MTAGLACSDCGTPLKPNPRRLGTRCKPCGARHMAQSPDKREKCRAAMKSRFADPSYHAAHRQRTGDGTRRALKDPARLEELRERGRRCGLLHLGHNRHGAGSPERAAAGRKRSETLLAWCPPEYRGEYRRLVQTKLVRAPEAQGVASTPGSDPEGDSFAEGSSLIPSRTAATLRPFGADGSGGPAGDECQNLVAVDVSPTLQAGGNSTGGHRPPGSTVDTVETLVGVRAPDVAGTLKACAGKSGSPNGAEELDRMVAVAFADTANTLAASDGGISGKDAADARLVAVPFDTTQITSATNGSNPQPGDPCHPLAAGAHPPSVAYAIQERAVSENVDAGPQGKGWQEDISFTLEARPGVQAVAFSHADVAPNMTSNGDAHSGFRDEHGLVAVSLDLASIPTVNGWAVRKLTPRECERLQGFPDDFTAIRWRGKEAADGPRYKAIGNSMAVNVMRWIGARIALVERAVAAAGGDT